MWRPLAHSLHSLTPKNKYKYCGRFVFRPRSSLPPSVRYTLTQNKVMLAARVIQSKCKHDAWLACDRRLRRIYANLKISSTRKSERNNHQLTLSTTPAPKRDRAGFRLFRLTLLRHAKLTRITCMHRTPDSAMHTLSDIQRLI